jgi:hypothetical protein
VWQLQLLSQKVIISVCAVGNWLYNPLLLTLVTYGEAYIEAFWLKTSLWMRIGIEIILFRKKPISHGIVDGKTAHVTIDISMVWDPSR